MVGVRLRNGGAGSLRLKRIEAVIIEPPTAASLPRRAALGEAQFADAAFRVGGVALDVVLELGAC